MKKEQATLPGNRTTEVSATKMQRTRQFVSEEHAFFERSWKWENVILFQTSQVRLRWNKCELRQIHKFL